MANIMTTANESDGFDCKKYVDLFEKYLGKKNIVDVVLMADMDKLNQKQLARVLKYYEMENSFLINQQNCSARVVVDDIATIEKRNMRLRHSETKLSTSLKNLIE
jgi:hypothetical protein